MINSNQPDREGVDKLIWMPVTNGEFTAKSTSSILIGQEGLHQQVWKEVWADIAPPRVEFFLWQVMRGRVPVRKLLSDWNMLPLHEVVCAFCTKEVESVNNLLFHCPCAWKIWMGICKSWNLTWVVPNRPEDILLFWNDQWSGLESQKVWKMLFFVTSWSLWLARNQIVFEGKNFDDLKIKETIILRLTSWHHARWAGNECQNSHSGGRNNNHQVEGTTRRDPAERQMTFNVDASVSAETGEAGIGGVLRDETGSAKVAFSMSMGILEPNCAEYMAILEAFSIYVESQWCNASLTLVVETDCLNAKAWALDPSKIHWRIAGKARTLESLKAKVRRWRIDKIPRSINTTADALARAGVRRPNKLLVFL